MITRHRLGLKNTEPDILGRAYEYLLRRFAEGQRQSAGEFYTPKEVGWLIAEMIQPTPLTTAYDHACGSGGLLIKARLLYRDRHPNHLDQAPKLYGQERNAAQGFMQMIREQMGEQLDTWLREAEASHLPELESFARGIRQDKPAVRAGLTLP